MGKAMKRNPWTEELRKAKEDYFALLSKGYPEKASLKLVGDHFSLDTIQRMILFRGVAPVGSAQKRKERLLQSVSGKALAVDGYNVLFTIHNYLLGMPVFISNDGIVRDAGGSYGRVGNDAVFETAMKKFAASLSVTEASSVSVFLDSPVSHSGRHKEELEILLSEQGIPFSVSVVKSADFMLKLQKSLVITTSDSAVIDKTETQVFDLARFIIDRYFSHTWESL